MDASSSRQSLDDTLHPSSLRPDVDPHVLAEGARDTLLGPSDNLAMDSQDLESEVHGDSGYSGDRQEVGESLDSHAREAVSDDALDDLGRRSNSHERLVHDLQKEIDTLNVRLVRAESDAGGHFGSIASELPNQIRYAVSEGLASLEQDLPHKISIDLRGELSRALEPLTAELNSLRESKRAFDTTSTQLKQFGSNLAELLSGQAQLHRSLSILSTRVDTLPTSMSHEIQTKFLAPLGTKLDSISHLVRGSQRNVPSSTSTPVKSSPLAPAPSPVPRVTKACYTCGCHDHTRANCPQKHDWCVRCLRHGHRHSACQDRDLECELCLSKGRASLALGHHRYAFYPFTPFVSHFQARSH